jgi:hypothetical protein
MVAGVRLAAALALLLGPRAPAPDPPAAARFPSVAAALEAALAGAGEADAAGPPLVVGFGELHQVTATAGIPSSLRRFTEQILPLLAPRASDLVVETWVTEGRCGKDEAAVVADVERTTERPQTTESEIVSLLRRAKESGLRPHILRIACADYQALLAPAAERGAAAPAVDYQRLLSLTEEKLEQAIRAALAARPAADAAKMVLVYGGALHNDLHPDRLLAPFSYGRALYGATGGRYVEIDLYVPAYLEQNEAMHHEPWYPVWRRSAQAAAAGEATLIRRSPASAIVIFPQR